MSNVIRAMRVSDERFACCPYCGHGATLVEAEDYTYDKETMTCAECGKRYWMQTEVCVTHATTRDCDLNGVEHTWRAHKLSSGGVHDFCDICDKCRPIEVATLARDTVVYSTNDPPTIFVDDSD